jgi:hypothetical protein
MRRRRRRVSREEAGRWRSVGRRTWMWGAWCWRWEAAAMGEARRGAREGKRERVEERGVKSTKEKGKRRRQRAERMGALEGSTRKKEHLHFVERKREGIDGGKTKKKTGMDD